MENLRSEVGNILCFASAAYLKGDYVTVSF